MQLRGRQGGQVLAQVRAARPRSSAGAAVSTTQSVPKLWPSGSSSGTPAYATTPISVTTRLAAQALVLAGVLDDGGARPAMACW